MAALTPEEWQRLSPLLDAVLDAPAEQRAALLEQLSESDPARRAELEALVAECEREEPLLERPAAERFAALFADQPVPLPERLGERYRIVRELGRGGMGVVLLARDLKHERDVAIKVIRPEVAAGLGRERFLRELGIVARLNHPHIVALYDSGEADGVLYFLMPYEAGGSLRERLLREGPLPVDAAVRVLRDVCAALAHAHRQGIVHCDIKPDNVLLAEGDALVTDFGVARARSAATAAAEPGLAFGTPAYMSPEQVGGQGEIGPASDIYAVGVLGYELLAGRPPFSAATPELVMEAQRTQSPAPLAERRPEVPAALAELVMQCLAKRPEDRPPSAEAVVQRLELLIAPSGGYLAPAPTEQLRRRRVQSMVLAVVAVLLVPLGFAIRARDRAGRPPVLDPGKIVVVPFRVTGVDSSLGYLGEGVVDLLSAKLTGEGGPVAVDSRSAISAWRQLTGGREATAEDAGRIAERLGVGEALLGSLVGGPGGRLTITASIIPGGGGAARPAATVTGRLDSLALLLDGIATRLVAREAGVAEQALSALTSRSVPALRAYLWGRAEYRRGHESEALDHFARALEYDSTFALAALDLAVASGQLLGQVLGQRTLYQVPGYVSSRPESDHRRFAGAVQTAMRYRDKLSARDRPLADALSGSLESSSSARVMLSALEHAATAAPDRAETHYLIGTLLLRQGLALGFTDSRDRAAASFRRALGLDSAYMAPVFGLVESAALAEDTAELRRVGALYLSRVRSGPAADYVRWRVAVGTGDAPALAALRLRFDSLATPALERIVQASQQSGVALGDADRAMALIVRRAADRVERNLAVMAAHWLAMNRGRPREALRYLRLRTELEPTEFGFWTHSVIAALFWDGDSAVGQASAKARALQIARDTLGPALTPALHSELTRSMSQDGLWALLHGDTARAGAAIRWLRRDRPLGADLVDVILATQARRPDAEAIRARLDSVAREGCCSSDLVAWVNLVLARAYESAGQTAEALAAIRRGIWRSPPQLLTTYLREEGRLAARLADRAGAIRAYRHYLALRSDPEPELRAEVSRVRGELAQLERDR